MKVLIGGFHQESNSFSSRVSDKSVYAIFKQQNLLEKHPLQTNSIMSGIISAVRKTDAEIIPAILYQSPSGGPVLKEVVDGFLREFLEIYDANTPIDGIFLDLHGATAMVGNLDACGYILEIIRKHVGKQVVIAHASDLHANISTKILKNADVIAGYQTYPHEDYFLTGQRAAEMGLMQLQGKKFHQVAVRLPMIIPAESYNTNEGVFADLINDAHKLVNDGKIMDFSIFQMQPWLDLNDAGGTVLVTAWDQDTAVKYANELAHRLFALRKEMQFHLYSVDEVIDAALTNKTDMPVILVDSADSASAGATGDSSFVLSRLLERGVSIRTCLCISDPAAVLHAFEIGVGNEGDFSLGGACDSCFQKSIQVHAYVKSLHDGIYFQGLHANNQNAGKTAVLQIGNITVVVFTIMRNSSNPYLYRSFGIEPAHYRLVQVKSATQYKLPYSKFSTLFYPTNTPGAASPNLAFMPFQNLPRPFYPLDDIDDFDDSVIFH